SLDTSFGNNGQVMFPFVRGSSSVALQVDGKIVVANCAGGQLDITRFYGDSPDILVTGADAGSESRVRVCDAVSGREEFNFIAYANFKGGVRVATGDVNGDGVPDII